MKELSIIIISFNTRSILKDCLNSVFQHLHGIEFETIVIDNASTDGSCEMIETKFPKVKLVRNKKNRGFGQANNQGIKIALGKHLLFLNSDTLVFDGSIQKLLTFLQKDAEVGVIAPQILNKDKTIQLSAFARFPNLFSELLIDFLLDRILNRLFPLWNYPGRFSLSKKQHKKNQEVAFVIGACFLAPKEIIGKVGGFDKRYFFYVEETDLMKRLKDKGYRVYFLSDAKIIHLGGASTAGKTNNKKYNYLLENWYQFFKLHYGGLYLFWVKTVDICGGIFSLIVLSLSWIIMKLFFGSEQKVQEAMLWPYHLIRFNFFGAK